MKKIILLLLMVINASTSLVCGPEGIILKESTEHPGYMTVFLPQAIKNAPIQTGAGALLTSTGLYNLYNNASQLIKDSNGEVLISQQVMCFDILVPLVITGAGVGLLICVVESASLAQAQYKKNIADAKFAHEVQKFEKNMQKLKTMTQQ